MLPRVGIKVDGPDWAEDDLDVVLANNKIIPVTQSDGTAIPGLAKYDPINDLWRGSDVDEGFDNIIDFEDDN